MNQLKCCTEPRFSHFTPPLVQFREFDLPNVSNKVKGWKNYVRFDSGVHEISCPFFWCCVNAEFV